MRLLKSGRNPISRPPVVTAACIVLIAGIAAIVPAAEDEDESGWRTDFSQAQQAAKRLNRPMLVHFYAHWCGPCRRMEREVLRSSDVQKDLSTRFVGVKVNSDRHPELVERFGVEALPTDVFVSPAGEVLARASGYQDKPSYLNRITRVAERFERSRRFRIARDDGTGTGRSREDESRKEEPQTKIAARDSEPPVPDGKSPSPRSSPSTESLQDGKGEPAASRPDSPEGETVVGLKGYSPVSLYKWRQWRTGSARFAATYQGIVYRLASAGELQDFRDDPGRYAPRLLGCDPVVLWKTDRAVAGSTKYGAFFNDHLYLFVSDENRQRFKQNPYRYTRTRHVLKLDQVQGLRRR